MGGSRILALHYGLIEPCGIGFFKEVAWICSMPNISDVFIKDRGGPIGPPRRKLNDKKIRRTTVITQSVGRV